MEKPFVSIVIPSFNSEKTIAKAIIGCDRQDYPRDLFEIIVVDDGSRDATPDIIRSYSHVLFIRQDHSGPATARNKGLMNARGSIVAFLDSDCVPRPAWLSKMVRRYTSEDVVCVGSRYGIANRSSLLACCIYFEFLVRYRRMPRHPKFVGSNGYSFRSDFLKKIGGYSEEYRMASHEDNELAYRIISKGYSTFFDKTNIVDHHFPTHILRYLRVQLWHGYWRMKLYVDHPRMVTGDDYTDIWDYLQPPVSLLILVLLPFTLLFDIRLIVILLLMLLIALQLPITISMIRLCGRKRYLAYIPLGVIRAGARSIGMAKGIIHFWILKK